MLAGTDPIDDWCPLHLAVKVDHLVDYLPNNLGVRLCSGRMRDVIDRNHGPRDEIQWLAAEVADVFERSHDYFVLHLPGAEDALDEKRSIMVGDVVVKPVIDAKKVTGRSLLRVPGASLTLFVSDAVRRALLKAGMTGFHFDVAPMSDAG